MNRHSSGGPVARHYHQGGGPHPASPAYLRPGRCLGPCTDPAALAFVAILPPSGANLCTLPHALQPLSPEHSVRACAQHTRAWKQ